MTNIETVAADPHFTRSQTQVDKKVKRTRFKSPYRDAKFRPLFRALEALHDEQRSGGTSVTYETRNHPFYPKLHLQASSPAPTPSPFPERLTDEEEIRDARFWRAYSVLLPHLRKHRVPAEWRDLSDVSHLEWFHRAMRASGGSCGFTLNLSDDIVAKIGKQDRSANWLGRRIANELKIATGRKVPFFFAFEVSRSGRLHIHGELQICRDEQESARKALRRAGGEWETTRQHQAKTKPKPSVVWANYSAKHWVLMREHRWNHSRPINGKWFFNANEVASLANELYSQKKLAVMNLIEDLSDKKVSQH